MSFYAILSAQVAASTEQHMEHANPTSAALLEIPVTTSLQKSATPNNMCLSLFGLTPRWKCSGLGVTKY